MAQVCLQEVDAVRRPSEFQRARWMLGGKSKSWSAAGLRVQHLLTVCSVLELLTVHRLHCLLMIIDHLLQHPTANRFRTDHLNCLTKHCRLTAEYQSIDRVLAI